MNLVQARAELAARGFDELDSGRLNAFLNVAKNQLEDAYPFPWLEVSEPAVQTYSEFAGNGGAQIVDLKHVLYVVVTSTGVELEGTTAQQIVADGGNIDDLGQPCVWWLDGANTIHTWPSSTEPITVRYVKEGPELTDDTDTPLIPARYHQTWIDLAVVRAHLDANAPDLAASVRAVAGQDLAQIINRYETRNRQNAQTQIIRGGAEDW